MPHISQHIQFSAVTELLENLHRAKTPSKKADLFTKYYTSFGKFRSTFLAQNPNSSLESTSFYHVLRLLLPDRDRERPAYGIKTTTLGKLVVRILAIDAQSAVAKRLMRKDDPAGPQNTEPSDYASVVYDVMKLRAGTICRLTVFDVNEKLDSIAENNVVGNKKKSTEEELYALFQGMTALDQMWLIRIILKKMRIGIGIEKLLTLLRVDANDMFACNSSLKMLCSSLEGGCAPALENVSGTSLAHVSPGHAFKPMLCAKIVIHGLSMQIANDEYYVQTKMDGERFQIHIDLERYHYFSRRGFDYTANFGKDLTAGSLTPDLSDVFKVPVTNCILDGEMMVWDRQQHVYHIKAEHTDVKALPRSHGTLRPAFCVYDVLLLNGVQMMHKPYAERVRLLNTLIRPKTGVISVGTAVRIRDAAHVLQCLNEAFDNREEGVVLKRADSTYCPGERTAGWYKIKPDYIDGLVTDLDLIVLGGYFNSSKTRLYKFLLGVYDKLPDSELGKFYACCNVFNGLNNKELVAVNELLRPHWNAGRRSAQSTSCANPPMIELGGAQPDVWIDPRNSVVFEIKASELVRSASFATEFSLRFPRVESVRSDKAWYDCCTLDELKMMCTEDRAVHKLTKRQLDEDDITAAGGSGQLLKAKRSRGRLTRVDASLDATANISPPATVVVLDTICEGLDFCVLSTSKNNGPSVQQLEHMIRAHGGNVLSNPTPTTFVCIAAPSAKLPLRVEALCRERSHNIASVEWLIAALGGDSVRSRLNDFQPSDMICCTAEQERKFAQRFDAFGDAYAGLLEADGLRKIIDQMDVESLPPATRSEIYQLEHELDITAAKAGNFFRLATAHFGAAVPPLVRILFEWHGGRTIDDRTIADASQQCDYKLSHAVVDAARVDDVATAAQLSAKRCVSYAWIVDSHDLNRKQSDKKYAVCLGLE